MIATSNLLEVIENSELLATYIAQSEIAINYKRTKKALNEDVDAQLLIAQFIQMKEKYEEVQRFGKYHPDFHNVSKEMRELKRKLDLHESIAQFKKAEAGLEQLLNEVSRIIADAVSPHIKVPTGNPFFDNRSCQGGCGVGGSCGCR
ncbi:YlbF family regulator [Pueribacillus sp. YX66]|uniref:YlbF family regulator n=1 Tax=Pueribacillus sp. YX66 TaxID=3229242 RepID=UPI00358CE0DD